MEIIKSIKQGILFWHEYYLQGLSNCDDLDLEKFEVYCLGDVFSLVHYKIVKVYINHCYDYQLSNMNAPLYLFMYFCYALQYQERCCSRYL